MADALEQAATPHLAPRPLADWARSPPSSATPRSLACFAGSGTRSSCWCSTG